MKESEHFLWNIISQCPFYLTLFFCFLVWGIEGKALISTGIKIYSPIAMFLTFGWMIFTDHFHSYFEQKEAGEDYEEKLSYIEKK